MPGKDGTGPSGTGPGRKVSGGRGLGGRGMGRGAGTGGDCVCPKCGKSVDHEAGRPCFEIKCPDCGIPMIRR